MTFVSLIFGNFVYQKSGDGVRITFSNDNFEGKGNLYKIIALPTKNAEIEVKNCEISIYSEKGKFLRTERQTGNDRVRITGSFVMRELFGHQIELILNKKERGEISKIKNIDFEIKPVDEVKIPSKISAAFLPVYKSFADNFSTSYLRDAEVVPSKMLIITHSNTIENLSDFIIWKNQRGIATEVVAVEEIGSTSTQIKSYIQNVYESSEEPPDYLLLVGDVDDDFEIPSFYISAENDVTDLPYTLLEGDDYFPEMLAGRFSIDSMIELITMMNMAFASQRSGCFCRSFRPSYKHKIQ